MRGLASSRDWIDVGTGLFTGALSRIDDDALAGPTELPAWTGKHLVAHVAGNAEALLNLVHWAATGEERPMYASPHERSAGIESGARQSPDELRRWATDSASRLAEAVEALTEEQWARTVRSAQGREILAAEIPWLRAREVMVHSVDLDPALNFSDLPEGFLVSLASDIVAKRSGGDQPALVLTADDGGHTWQVHGRGERTDLHGSLPDLVAYLAGRRGGELTSASGAVPALPSWL